jgi:hypothetical protein
MSLLHVKKPLSETNERLSRDNERHLVGSGRHRETTKRHPVTQVMLSVTTMTLSLDKRTTSCPWTDALLGMGRRPEPASSQGSAPLVQLAGVTPGVTPWLDPRSSQIQA